jgi:hypothetical protein
MPTLPIPIRAAVGLAATAMDEARKLPETLPQAVTTVPMIAVSTAMQASLRVQQHIATLAARGDEVLSRLHRTSAQPPPWATFDDPPSETPNEGAAPSQAAFDKIDYEHTGFHEGDDVPSRWDAVGVCDEGDTAAAPPLAKSSPPKKRAPRKAPAKKTTLAEDLAAEAAQPDE